MTLAGCWVLKVTLIFQGFDSVAMFAQLSFLLPLF